MNATDILTEVARATWRTSHDGAKCPAAQIPPADELVTWWNPPWSTNMCEAMDEANKRLCATLGESDGRPASWPFLFGPVAEALKDPREDMRDVSVRQLIHTAIEGTHTAWRALPKDTRPRHPLAPLVSAWQARPAAVSRATVTEAHGMIRRPVLATQARILASAVDAVRVDGEPVAVRLPDVSEALAPRRPERDRKWTISRPGEQGRLPLHGLAPLPVDLRMAALAPLQTVIAGDVLALWGLADALDWSMILDERTGARLLARTRAGGFRSPRASDVHRFWDAARELSSLNMLNPKSGQWANIAHVEGWPAGSGIVIGPPAWRRFGKGLRYTLTAEGGHVARARVTVGQQGAGGRLITAIEYALAARYLGERGIPKSLRSATEKAGPGPVVTLPLSTVAMLIGETDPRTDTPAYRRLDRAISAIERDYQSGSGRDDSAPAGDSVEFIARLRGGRARPASIQVRASARFVEAARRANLADGHGFEVMRFADWVGLNNVSG